MNPLTANLRFKLRSLTNCIWAGAIFIPIAFIAAHFPYTWIVDVVAIGILFYLYFYLWEKRPIGLRCQHCRNYIIANTPWKCGSCKKSNTKVDDFPFVNRCEHCTKEPNAYKCHHCNELIFLTSDKSRYDFASHLNAGEEIETTKTDKETLRKEAKLELAHEIELVELSAKLEESKKRASFSKKRTVTEEIEESYKNYFGFHMGREEFARRQRKVNAKEFRNDAEMLRKANALMDSWLRDSIK